MSIILAPGSADLDQIAKLVPIPAPVGALVVYVPQVATPVQPRRHWLIAATIICAAALSCIYFAFVAADRYESEASFMVRRSTGGTTQTLDKLLQSTGIARASDETFAVEAFVKSRDGMKMLETKLNLRQVLTSPIWDPFRGGSGYDEATEETLFKAYKSAIDVEIDTDSGLGLISVQAYTPENARLIADALLTSSETLVNRLGERAATNVVQSAEEQVRLLEYRVAAAQAAMSSFRAREEVLDPARLSITIIENIGELSAQVSNLRASLAQLRSSAPTSPHIRELTRRIAALEAQIAAERAKLAGGGESVASILAEYETLLLEREFSEKALTAAMGALELARSEARQQRLFLERVVEPRTPDKAQYPYRLLWIAVTLLVAGLAWRATTPIDKLRFGK